MVKHKLIITRSGFLCIMYFYYGIMFIWTDNCISLIMYRIFHIHSTLFLLTINTFRCTKCEGTSRITRKTNKLIPANFLCLEGVIVLIWEIQDFRGRHDHIRRFQKTSEDARRLPNFGRRSRKRWRSFKNQRFRGMNFHEISHGLFVSRIGLESVSVSIGNRTTSSKRVNHELFEKVVRFFIYSSLNKTTSCMSRRATCKLSCILIH